MLLTHTNLTRINSFLSAINYIFVSFDVLYYCLDENEQRLDALAHNYLEKIGIYYICTLCSQKCRDRSAAKLHLESKHFPTENGYSCDICGKQFNTKNAFNTHKSYQHK